MAKQIATPTISYIYPYNPMVAIYVCTVLFYLLVFEMMSSIEFPVGKPLAVCVRACVRGKLLDF